MALHRWPIRFCSAATSEGDTVHLLLHPPASTAERIDRRERLQRLLTPSTDRETLHEVVEGRRVLARVPLAGAEQVLERLSSRGIPARAARGKWAPLPDSLLLIACGMVLSGMAAGLFAGTLFFWLSPTMAGLIVMDAQRRMRRPVLLPPANRLTLSPATGKLLAETLSQLPEGTARELLAELARGVHSLMLRLMDDGAEQSGAAEAEELLVHACAAARDLAAVEAHLSDLESQRGRLNGDLERWAENLSDTERTRDRLVQRLLDALAVLGRSRTRTLEAAGLGHESLDQTGAELELEVKAYVEGLREVAELMKSKDEVPAGA